MSHNITKSVGKKGGFTLLEILLVVGIISILAGIVILAINPTKQLGDTRNAQRRSDVLTILNAIYQYNIDGNDIDVIDSGGPLVQDPDCDIDTGTLGSALEDSLVSDYLTDIPVDPLDDSQYRVSQNATTNRVTVCAPMAEESATISVTR